MLLKNVITVLVPMANLVGYVIPIADERKRVFKLTKIPTIQTVSDIDKIGKPPVSTESTSVVSCAALLMQYGPFTCMEYYDLQTRCRSYHEGDTVVSLNNKMNSGWSIYNAKPLGKSYKECRLNYLGREYRGNKNTTGTGLQCMVWSATSPHLPYANVDQHLTLEESPDILNTNYCRNPDFSPGGPWCYTTDLIIRWEYCDIPYCHCYS